MICILSIKTDQTTNEVMDWVEYLRGVCIRINSEDILADSKFDILLDNEINFNINNTKVSANKIKSVWYRKWNNQVEYSQEKENANAKEIIQGLNIEYNEISNFIFQYMENANWLNSPNDKKYNKLYQLKIASEVGLEIPKTVLTNNKETLLKTKQTYKQIISKPLLANLSLIQDNEPYCSYTIVIDNEFLYSQSEIFPPSLLQEQIDKDYEIRCFYLNKSLHSMAIFSQNDDQTKVDFRQYNSEKPNRTVPYILPTTIEEKITSFMAKLKMDSGSLDLIKDKNGRFVFLEVNPIGQFGMVSKPCNYYLEKEVAKFLISIDK